MQTDKMQKNDKMQIGQNAKVLNINNPKYSILGVPIENQCVKGGGLLYGGFGLPIFGIFCILSGLHFVCFDVLSHLHFVKFAFCHRFGIQYCHFWRIMNCPLFTNGPAGLADFYYFYYNVQLKHFMRDIQILSSLLSLREF